MDVEKVVFMGTPDFAVPTLTALIEARFADVLGVVTQPDRPAGRKRRPRPSPVKRVAMAHNLALLQPKTLDSSEAMAQLVAWEPDTIVVAAFGQILGKDVLDLPPHGCVNVHASLLPRWRGAAPVPAAILAGDEVTGVTIMCMDTGIDTGAILAQRQEPIRSDDTWGTLERRLAQIGAELLVETLPGYLSGEITPRPQPKEDVTYAPQLRKADGSIDWTCSAVRLARHVRAFTPWPGAFTTLHGKRFKILQATPLPGWRGDAPPGTVCALEDGGVAVATGEGALRLEEVQLAGKRRMDIAAFLCGQRDCVGSCLGAEIRD